MGSTDRRKPHVVCVPYPSQGHVTPMMWLSKLLHSRGFHVTFVNTDFNHRRLIRSHGHASVAGLPDFRFESIPDGLPPPPDHHDATQDVPALCDSTRKNCLGPFRLLLQRLVPPVTCVVSDGVMSFAIEAAREIGVPEVQFWTASACSFMGYLHYRELISRGIFPFKDKKFMSDGTLDTPIDWIPGMRNIRLKDLPSFLRTTDPNDIMFDFMGEEAQNCLNATTIIFNTFDAFEHEVLEAVAEILPEEFLEEIKGRALLVSWCNQVKVLAHSSIGAFLTHCGWNSTLETVCEGVPVICWPFFADQQTNCRYACTDWGIGLEVGYDVKREEVEGLVREMMEGDKGKELKRKAWEWKQKAEESTDVGGSSYINFDRFIKEALHCME
ncbi:UDP-glycosyltransferase [Actinidia chinensis var. chinensis]|uniref:UDP-glycosyltransferase n=1 Tax=Actinidia chinensis var. chinensis TaxID=1590841 RepID=A0A2R6RDE8_ACTCC|nr:UDP-glycosyltransferase [Actinidia chinensis var. chinensis]